MLEILIPYMLGSAAVGSICRAKAPLVRAAYDLLKNNVPACILGKDLGRGLLAYVDAVSSNTPLLASVRVRQ